jgi:hypothetical protein
MKLKYTASEIRRMFQKSGRPDAGTTCEETYEIGGSDLRLLRYRTPRNERIKIDDDSGECQQNADSRE